MKRVFKWVTLKEEYFKSSNGILSIMRWGYYVGVKLSVFVVVISTLCIPFVIILDRGQGVVATALAVGFGIFSSGGFAKSIQRQHETKDKNGGK